MDDVQKKRTGELRADGYNPIEVYEAEPNEEDLDHSHTFDTYIVMLSGEMLLRMDGKEKVLRANEEIFIPKGTTHYSKVMKNGCKFIIAERH